MSLKVIAHKIWSSHFLSHFFGLHTTYNYKLQHTTQSETSLTRQGSTDPPDTSQTMGSAALPILAASTTTLLLTLALLSHHSHHPISPVQASTTESTANTVTSFSQFPLDENQHLSSHIFAYPATEPCRSIIEGAIANEGLYQHLPIAVDGEVSTTLFGETIPTASEANTQTCPAVCLDRGVDAHLIPYPMPEKYYNIQNTHGIKHDSLSSFLGSHSCGKVEIALINYTPQILDLYWVDHNDKEVFLYKLERMEKNTRFIHTFITHRFRAKHPDTQEVLFDEVVEFAGTFGIGNHANPHRDRDIRQQVRSVMDGEWRKKSMVTRTFSRLGFDKGRLPLDLYGSMRSFYYNNR